MGDLLAKLRYKVLLPITRTPEPASTGPTFAQMCNGSPANTPKRPFFEIEFLISLYRIAKGAWKIRESTPQGHTAEPLIQRGSAAACPES